MKLPAMTITRWADKDDPAIRYVIIELEDGRTFDSRKVRKLDHDGGYGPYVEKALMAVWVATGKQE